MFHQQQKMENAKLILIWLHYEAMRAAWAELGAQHLQGSSTCHPPVAPLVPLLVVLNAVENTCNLLHLSTLPSIPPRGPKCS